MKEGCLSVPRKEVKVCRPKSITIQYLTKEGLVAEKVSGFQARIIHHEYDHLEGKIILDYVK